MMREVNLLRNVLAESEPLSPHHAVENAIVRGLWLALALECAWASAHLWPSLGSFAFLAVSVLAGCVALFTKLNANRRSIA